MKKINWLLLFGINMLVIVCMFLPFLPGPYDKLAYGLSAVAQLLGFSGLLLVPIGILWLIQEIRNVSVNRRSINNWRNGHYYAIGVVSIFILISLFIAMMLLANVGVSAAAIGLLVLAFVLYRSFPAIKKLKPQPNRSFNSIPLYLISVPVIAFAVRWFFIGDVSDRARDYAIKQGEKLIYAIESYYDQQGEYPESIENLYWKYDIPKPSVMGIDNFQYVRNGNAYNLSFIQWQHFGATEEIVMYNKNDQHTVKGHFASYSVKKPHWKYYWLD